MIVYLVLAHRNLDQISRLMSRLVGERARVLLHVDARTDIASHEASWRSMEGVDLAVKRRRCDWGGFSLVQATLDLVAQALREQPTAERLILLSGQDYPIKPAKQIHEFLLDAHPGTSFMEYHRLPRSDWGPDGGLSRISDIHFRVAGRRRSLRNTSFGLPRRLPSGVVPYQGGQYWSLTRQAAEFVADAANRRADVLRIFRRAAVPDELVFQTLLMNSPLAGTIRNDDLRFERWESGASHPAVLTTDDLEVLAASDALFAKKLDQDVDSALLDAIDRELLV